MSEGSNVDWRAVAKVNEIAAGDSQAIEIENLSIGIFNIGGELYAISNICTHQFALLTAGYLEGEIIECPLHQAHFHVPTGKALSPPADKDLKTYPIRIVGTDILVGLTCK